MGQGLSAASGRRHTQPVACPESGQAQDAPGGITDKDFGLARKIEEVVLWRPAGGPLGTGNPKPFVYSKQ